MVDHDVWWGNQEGFGMRKGVIPILPVMSYHTPLSPSC